MLDKYEKQVVKIWELLMQIICYAIGKIKCLWIRNQYSVLVFKCKQQGISNMHYIPNSKPNFWG